MPRHACLDECFSARSMRRRVDGPSSGEFCFLGGASRIPSLACPSRPGPQEAIGPFAIAASAHVRPASRPKERGAPTITCGIAHDTVDTSRRHCWTRKREREIESAACILCVSLSTHDTGLLRVWTKQSVLRPQISRQAPTKRHTRIRDPSVLTRNTRAAEDTRVQRASRGAQYPTASSSPTRVAGPRALERVRSAS